ncbi:GyrI-like domain-containing protein [Paenibacillus eucommiae]|uniref:Transcriptional regulator YdeE n=1 Tax=Paenibacillus eucommiae TaxID=1355755 RepID=A0ABS4IWH6_9BACL|nr:effector binding domain-containing protein [Paenibacillus eucommiae]MBP1991922.1 putative transcriptional regulator YdeE [Paenibacillus eucommiae]
MKCKIIVEKELKLVGVEIICPFTSMEVEIPDAWKSMKIRKNEVSDRRNDDILYGMYPQSSDSPDTNKCYYYICVEVNSVQNIPPEMIQITIPPQRYVSYNYRGPIKNFNSAYERVNSFIETQGFEHNLKAFVLEIKGPAANLLDKETADNEIELRIPILASN